MIMFGKPIFADMSTDYYKKELYKYEAVDPYGNKYESGRICVHDADAAGGHQSAAPRHHGCLLAGVSRYRHARV